MIRINLLPEEFRRRKRKIRISVNWGYVVAAVVGVLLILLVLTIWQKSRLGRLEKNIYQTRMEAERQKADLELVQELIALKERILQHVQVVEELNQSRTRWLEILAALSGSVPGEMWLVSLRENSVGGNFQAQVQGMSFSLKPIAVFMDNLDETELFSNSQFTYAQRLAVHEGMAYDFEIVADLLSYERKFLSQKTSSDEKDAKGKRSKQKR